MSLRFPDDLDEWAAWQGRRHRLRKLKARVRADQRELHLYAGGPAPTILVVAEGLSASYRAAFLACLGHLPLSSVVVLAPPEIALALPEHDWQRRPVEQHESVRAVLAPGHYTELGQMAWKITSELDVPYYVAQHGLMTPLAPPLPVDAHLLAWSDADAEFWWSGRRGTSTVVGSQLLWAAGRVPQSAAPDPSDRPVYLGQLHGAELPRLQMAAAAAAFCRQHGATYRPHPSEVDRLSRWTHRAWERRGITIDRSAAPLHETRTPVVSVFSTGVLESAARGLPSWVDFPDPPPWLREFWARYDLRPYGGDPTPPPPQPAVEPAVAVAEILRSYL